MSNNPLIELTLLGQSIWFDNIERRLITSGELTRMIDEDGLRGVTSNPAIFEKAISGSDDYLDQLRQLAEQQGSATEIYETLAISDIQAAADVLAPVYEATGGIDGYVSLECSPLLAHDTEGTIEEARRLWRLVNRKNVMIKIPGTVEGIPAIEQCLYEGININITLLFSLSAYQQTIDAYIKGLERRAAEGKPVDNIGSVASFFVSRIDTAVDKRLEEMLARATGDDEKAKIKATMGRVAIANAKVAYQRFREHFHGERFEALRQRGAKVQRPLWASTSTKNPAYRDTYYVEALIGPETVDTIPPATYKAFKDHGIARLTLEENLEEERAVLARLQELGVSLDDITSEVLHQGVKLFVEPFEKLLQTIRTRRDEIMSQLGTQRPVKQTISAGEYADSISETVARFEQHETIKRIWNEDATFWKTDPEHQKIISNALGWLTVADMMSERADEIVGFAKEVRAEGIQTVVLLGMGGSSLCPEVLRRTFGRIGGYPELLVLDSTVPAAVRSIESRIDLGKSLFIVASKSGTTTEPQVFFEYFFDKVKQAVGDKAGRHFIAITDPETILAEIGASKGFRRVFLNPADIGGRYSALSYFGMVPAALAGYDIRSILATARRAMAACAAGPQDNPGTQLGAAIGVLATKGRNKLTFVTPAPIDSLGLWIEQLVAESTGKEGVGILPVASETLGSPTLYGNDRVFVYIRCRGTDNLNIHSKLAALEAKGHPVITRTLGDPLDLGEEFFVWEFATAIAGAILRINPFDQPNVQESKDNTRRLLEEYEKTGRLPEQDELVHEGSFRIFASGPMKTSLTRALAGSEPGLASVLNAHLASVKAGDYVALTAYIEETPEHDELLRKIREHIRDSTRVATTVGYGPRFLHSTGQLHKGGPATGVFIQITGDDSEELPLPGRTYSFSVLKQAQALGDFESLASRNLRALRFHGGVDIGAGLRRLLDVVREARPLIAGMATD